MCEYDNACSCVYVHDILLEQITHKIDIIHGNKVGHFFLFAGKEKDKIC